MTNADDASAAVAHYNGMQLEDRELNCEIARPRTENTESRRGGGRKRRGGGRRRRAPRDPDALDEDGNPKNPSLLAVFVANIPYSWDSDDDFLHLFDIYNPVQAHLVRPRHGGRPKGFGFVKFSTHEDQQAAIAGMNDVEIDGRHLAVKAALSDNPYEKYVEDKANAEIAEAQEAALSGDEDEGADGPDALA